MAETEGPVKGDKAVKRMMNRALHPGSSSDEENPIDKALKLKEKVAASNIIDSMVEGEEAKAAKAKAEAARAIEGGSGATSPFQVKGSIDLGSFNYQDAINQANQRVEDMKKEFKEQLSASGQANLQLQDKIHEQQTEILKLTFGAQIQALKDTIAAGVGKKDFLEQYNEVMGTAKALGVQIAGPGQISSPELQLQILKIEHEHALALEAMKDSREESRRQWDLKLRELDEKSEATKAEFARQQQRDQFFFQAPETIGGAIARGIIESKGGSGIAQATPQSPPRGKQAFHIEAPPGEGGETNCPNCNEIVGIGPTARSAVCPGCGLKIPITRITTPAPEAPPGAPPGEVAEEEESGERRREQE
jgi:hypothetical protein